MHVLHIFWRVSKFPWLLLLDLKMIMKWGFGQTLANNDGHFTSLLMHVLHIFWRVSKFPWLLLSRLRRLIIIMKRGFGQTIANIEISLVFRIHYAPLMYLLHICCLIPRLNITCLIRWWHQTLYWFKQCYYLVLGRNTGQHSSVETSGQVDDCACVVFLVLRDVFNLA